MSTTRPGIEVRLENLSRRYSGVTALDGLNLTMAPGELVALLGPSGCGKTTALRLVAGLEDADGGRVVIGGQDVTNVPANKREIGMVFQAYSLFPHMTAMQNVEFGMQLHEVGPAERHKRAGDMLELVGLSAHVNKYANQMSGGQQQRVALARALAIEPKVLLLDEPLSALDAKVRARLRDEIRRVYCTAWDKHLKGLPLEALEQQLVAIIGLHPEYQALLADTDAALARDFTPEMGQTNPFLLQWAAR